MHVICSGVRIGSCEVRCLSIKLSLALFFLKKVVFFGSNTCTVNCLFILEETFAVFGSVSGLVTSKMFGFAARVNTYELIREHSVRDSGTKYSLWTPDSCHATKLEHFGF